MHAVVGGTNGSESMFVCRSPGGGGDLSRAGQLSWDGCSVAESGSTKVYKTYQVLVNVDGSARLEWKDWRQFEALPQGAINVANDVYVAREIANAAMFNYVGGLYLQEQYGLIILPPQGRRLTIGKILRLSTRMILTPKPNQIPGQLLVEHDPVRYELVSFKPDRLRSVQSTDVTLKDPIVLTNRNPTRESVESGIKVNYTHDDEVYFGRGHNIPTGSSVLLHFTNGTRMSFRWGIPKKHPVTTRMRLGGGQFSLPPKSKSEAHVMATRVERRWDYFATLSAHYEDGAILMRPVKGVFRQITFHHLRPVYTTPVFIDDGHASSASDARTRPTKARGEGGDGNLNFASASSGTEDSGHRPQRDGGGKVAEESSRDKDSLVFHPSRATCSPPPYVTVTLYLSIIAVVFCRFQL